MIRHTRAPVQLPQSTNFVCQTWSLLVPPCVYSRGHLLYDAANQQPSLAQKSPIALLTPVDILVMQ